MRKNSAQLKHRVGHGRFEQSHCDVRRSNSSLRHIPADCLSIWTVRLLQFGSQNISNAEMDNMTDAVLFFHHSTKRPFAGSRSTMDGKNPKRRVNGGRRYVHGICVKIMSLALQM
jgi:hypothetical protein